MKALRPRAPLKIEFDPLSKREEETFSPCTPESENMADGEMLIRTESLGEYRVSKRGLRKTSAGGENSDLNLSSSSIYFSDKVPIGRGASGQVFRAVHTPSSRCVAVKTVKVFDQETKRQIMNELKAIFKNGGSATSLNNSEGLVKFWGGFFEPNTSEISFVLDLMDGSLADILASRRSLPEPIIRHIAKESLKGLYNLHSKRVIHRDIKPSNILVSSNGEVKLSDFGISKSVTESYSKCATFCGTCTYMSPERINNASYSYVADIWSLGVTLLECAIGKYPYDGFQGPIDLMLHIVNDAPPVPPDNLSDDLKDILTCLLEKDPEKRQTAESLLNHPFFTETSDMAEVDKFICGALDVRSKVQARVELVVRHMYALADKGPNGILSFCRELYEPFVDLKLDGQEHSAEKLYVPILNFYSKACNIKDFQDVTMLHRVLSLDYMHLGEHGLHMVTAIVSVQCKESGGQAMFSDAFIFKEHFDIGRFTIKKHVRRSLKQLVE